MTLFNTPAVVSKTLRVLARLIGYPDADLRDNLPALRDALHAERALTPPRLVELDVLIDSLERAHAARRGSRLRRALRSRPLDVVASFRARARRLARPRTGDDRPGQDLRDGRPSARRGRTAGLPAGGARIHVDTAATRSARVPGRDGAHPERDLRRVATTRQRLRQHPRRAAGACRREGAAGERSRQTRRSMLPGKSRSSSTAARRRARPGPINRNRFKSSARTAPAKEREHDHAARLSSSASIRTSA